MSSLPSSTPSNPSNVSGPAPSPEAPNHPDPAAAPIVRTLRAAGCVFAEDEARLLVEQAPNPTDLAAMVEQRATGLPLEHVLGWAQFYGLRIAISPRVFVPRLRTELLARQAIALARQARRHADPDHPAPAPVVVDLCCGSGAVGAAVSAALGRVELHASDIDPAAVHCARQNLTGARVYQGDLYAPLPVSLRGRVDVLVANAPYVPTEAIELMPPEARLHEPMVALDGGWDGLDVLRRVITEAPDWLAAGGSLLVEAGARQAQQACESFTRSGLAARVLSSADLDATIVIGTR